MATGLHHADAVVVAVVVDERAAHLVGVRLATLEDGVDQLGAEVDVVGRRRVRHGHAVLGERVVATGVALRQPLLGGGEAEYGVHAVERAEVAHLAHRDALAVHLREVEEAVARHAVARRVRLDVVARIVRETHEFVLARGRLRAGVAHVAARLCRIPPRLRVRHGGRGTGRGAAALRRRGRRGGRRGGGRVVRLRPVRARRRVAAQGDALAKGVGSGRLVRAAARVGGVQRVDGHGNLVGVGGGG